MVAETDGHDSEVAIDYKPGPTSIDLKDGKLWKEILSSGQGDDTPQDGVEVFVHYIGSLTDGTEFDRSNRHGNPFSFILGKKSVISGWEIGVASMKKGEVCKLIIHPELGYGTGGSGKIPGNATLIFEIELLEWKYEDLSPNQNGGIVRKIIKAGASKYYHPNEGATVKVQLEGFHEGRSFDKRQVEFILGEASEHEVCPGVEHALYKISEGETSELTIQAKYAFGSNGNAEFNIPPDAEVKYIVTLLNFTKGKEAWSLDGVQKMECAREFKEKGTKFFKEKKYALARTYYKKIVDFLKMEALLNGEIEEERKWLLATAHFNQSQCSLELAEYLVAKNSADEGLQIQPDNVKGLFRRGLGNLGLKEPRLAKKDFEKVLELEPTNKLAAQKLHVSNEMIKEDSEKERKLYAKMFGAQD